MARNPITITDIPSISCRRLLAGTLYTSHGIDRQILITINGSELSLEPFASEIHSTIFASRIALIEKRDFARLPAEALTLRNTDDQYRLLAKFLAGKDLRICDTLILSLGQNPTLVSLTIQS